jgi:hypothetical protein
VIEIGTLAAGVTASVDADGTVTTGGVALRARVVGDAGKARTERVGVAPVAQTRRRVQHGDAVQRVYAADDAVIVEVENASPEAIVVAFTTDDAARLSLPRRPGDVLVDGALVFPVPHRTRVRVALAPRPVDVNGLPDLDHVERAWERILDRGLRTELPDPLQTEIDAARADLLLAPPSVGAYVTLHAYGFHQEADTMRPRIRGRWRIRRAPVVPGLLGDVHRALARERRNAVELLPGFRSEWLGANLAVHDFPLASGRASFAVRWHGARPALLWEVPNGVRITMPLFDPTFSSVDPVGETLLAAPPTALLPMGRAAVDGDAVDAPEEFS